MQRVMVITSPERIVTLEQAKQHLRVDSEDDDALIGVFIDSAIGHIDGPDGWLGRAIGEQTLEARLDGFVSDPIRLPYPPVIDVTAVVYEDVGGADRTLDAETYEVRDDVIGTAWGKSWPQTRAYRGAGRSVRITYRAGYETVPAPIVVAVLLMVGDMYRNRETSGSGTLSAVPMSTTVNALLQPFRMYT